MADMASRSVYAVQNRIGVYITQRGSTVNVPEEALGTAIAREYSNFPQAVAANLELGTLPAADSPDSRFEGSREHPSASPRAGRQYG